MEGVKKDVAAALIPKEIPYRIIRSKRRTLALEITRDAEIIVRAPNRCPLREIERFVSGHQGWLDKHLTRVQQRLERHPEPPPEEAAALLARAREVLPQKLAHYAALMGLHPTGLRITSAKTRFGSCSPKNSICFSWRLMQYPDAAVDYVVVHELAHIQEKNHGRAFYALVGQYLPDWRERRALLKE